jgi:hypothetical protein
MLRSKSSWGKGYYAGHTGMVNRKNMESNRILNVYAPFD